MSGKAENLVDLMTSWCREGAEVARLHYRNTGELEFKDGTEAVTEADRLIEQLLRDRIRENFPEDKIVGEEFGGEDSSADDSGEMAGEGRTWFIDPIDGTLNYALGLPNYCLSLALVDCGQVVAACIHQPSCNDTFTAVAAGGTYLNGKRVFVRQGNALAESIVCLQLKNSGRVMSDPALLHSLVAIPFKMRRCGAIALEMAWVAAGFCDTLLASFGGRIHPWDSAAGVLLIREAGGLVVDFSGAEYKLGGPEMIVGSPKGAHEMLELLAKLSD